MKQWMTPEISELTAQWTEMVLNASGYDALNEENPTDLAGEPVTLGSCC